MTSGTFQGGGYVTTTPQGGPPPTSPMLGIPAIMPGQPDPFYLAGMMGAVTLFARRSDEPMDADEDALLWSNIQRYGDALADYLRQRTAYAAQRDQVR